MEPKQNHVDDFFSKLPEEDKEEVDIFEEKDLTDSPKSNDATAKDSGEESLEVAKNRRQRRQDQKDREKDQMILEMNDRIRELSEQDKFIKEVGEDHVIPDIAKIFDASDIGKENALKLSKVIMDSQRQAKEDALNEFKDFQRQAVEEEKRHGDFIDSELESLEDQFNVDLTSDSPKARKARREFLEMVERLSPKDEGGDITDYADFGATFQEYQKTSTREKTVTRREEIADRSMKRSNMSTETVKQRSTGFDGWKRDIEKGII